MAASIYFPTYTIYFCPKKSDTPAPAFRTTLFNIVIPPGEKTGKPNWELVGNDYRVRLVSVNMDKEMYKPCHIEAVLDFDRKNPDTSGSMNIKDADVKAIVNILRANPVIYVYNNDNADKVCLAQNYRLFSIKPRRRFDSLKYLTICVSIYSPDKLVDMEKANKCYTARQLGNEVFADIFGNLMVDGVNVLDAAKDIACSDRQRLFSKNAAKNSTEDLDPIQPYMVQYDETALHFLARMANRCGEFMYYENGKMTLGLNSNDKKKQVSLTTVGQDPTARDIEEISYTDLSDNLYNDDQYAEYTMDYTQKSMEAKSVDGSGKNLDAMRLYDGPAVEDLASFPKNEPKSEFLDQWSISSRGNTFGFWVENLSCLLNQNNVISMVSEAAAIVGLEAMLTGLTRLTAGNDYKDNYVTQFEKNDEAKKDTHAKQIDNDCVRMFTENNLLLTPEFYTINRRMEKYSGDRAIHVVLDKNCTKNVMLGDIVTIDDNDEYVVTKVHQEASVEAPTAATAQLKRNVVAFDALPLIPSDVAETNKLAGECFLPAILDDNMKRTAAPQRAIVVDNNDPLGLGRVRVMYPWQKYTVPANLSDDDKKRKIIKYNEEGATPFIRVTQPFASAKAGIKFTPQVGDEVIIGYELDDVERPFMLGAVASVKNNGGDAKGASDVIQSSSGHKIVFNNPNSASAFIESFSPTMRLLSGIIPGINNLFKDTDKTLGGSMSITDEHGICFINLNTDRRKIWIKSALGNIMLDALTGISISAPNGDVTITGKNVKIQAGNKVEIVSGTNINKQKLYQSLNQKNNNLKYTNESHWVRDEVTTLIKSFTTDYRVAGLLTPIDMSTVRTFMDALLKPVNGTLLLKSNRFTRIEAGDGVAKMPAVYRSKTDQNGQINKSNTTLENDKIRELKAAIYNKLATAQRIYNRRLAQNQDNAQNRTNYLNHLEDQIRRLDIQVGQRLLLDNEEKNKDQLIEGLIQVAGGNNIDNVREYIQKIKLANNENVAAGEEQHPIHFPVFLDRQNRVVDDLHEGDQNDLPNDAVRFLQTCGDASDTVNAAAQESATVKKRHYYYLIIQNIIEDKSSGLTSQPYSTAFDKILGTTPFAFEVKESGYWTNYYAWKQFLKRLKVENTDVSGIKSAFKWIATNIVGLNPDDIYDNSVALWDPSGDGQILFSDNKISGTAYFHESAGNENRNGQANNGQANNAQGNNAQGNNAQGNNAQGNNIALDRKANDESEFDNFISELLKIKEDEAENIQRQNEEQRQEQGEDAQGGN